MAKAGKQPTPDSDDLVSALRDLQIQLRILGGTKGALIRAPSSSYRSLLTRAKAAPIPKLAGKAWVFAAYRRRAEELRGVTITEGSRILAEASKVAPDCAKPLSTRYVERLLRELGVFPKKPR